jgi:hypothetical protein
MTTTNRTFFLTLQIGSSTTQSLVNIYHAVKKIRFRSLACESNVAKYCVIQSDMINNETVSIAYRDATFSASTAQVIEYHFVQPVMIKGNYTFTFKNLDNTPVVPAAIESYVFVAEFIGDKDMDKDHV